MVRTIRRVELWTVFRLSGGVYLALWAVGLLTFALLWWIAGNTGTTGNIESFLRDVGFKNFTFNGAELLLAGALGGLVLVLAATLLTTVVAALVNLVSEVTGGIRLVVVESPLDDLDPAGTRVADAGQPEPVGVMQPAPPLHDPPSPLVGPAAAMADRPHHEVRAVTGTANPRRTRPLGSLVDQAADDAEAGHDGAGKPPALGGRSWSERAADLLRGAGPS